MYKLSYRVTADGIPVTTKEMCIAPKAGKMKCRMTMRIAARYLNVMPVVDTEYAQVQIFVHVRSAGKKGIKALLKSYAKMKLYFLFRIFSYMNSHYSYSIRDGTACDICIPMPGCINGACKTEEVNGVPVEIAQTCQCNTFPEDHSLGSTVAKFEGPRCDRRKFLICLSCLNCSQLEPGF